MKLADHGKHTRLGGILQQIVKTKIQPWFSFILKCGGRVEDQDSAMGITMASPKDKTGQGEPGEEAGAVSLPSHIRNKTGSSDAGRPLQGNLDQGGHCADSPPAPTNMQAQRRSALRQLFGDTPSMPKSGFSSRPAAW